MHHLARDTIFIPFLYHFICMFWQRQKWYKNGIRCGGRQIEGYKKGMHHFGSKTKGYQKGLSRLP